MITFQNVSFTYEGMEEPSLNDISLSIKEGEFILLTGKSGCGKTTMVRIINGLIPDFYTGTLKGSVFLFGKPIEKINIHEKSEWIGTVFQDPRSQFFMTETTGELSFACSNMGYSQSEILERVSSTVQELNLENLINCNIFNLSSGEKQKIAIGSVYALHPKIYVLDEPAANLDYQATVELGQLLRKLKAQGNTIIISEHRFYYFRDLIDRVYYFEDGINKKCFTKEEFLKLKDEERIKIGLRSVYPENLVNKNYDWIINQNSMLQIKDIEFFYAKKENIINRLSFNVQGGEVIGVFGKNGEGKTTLQYIICGLLKEKKGEFRYDNKKIRSKKRQKLCSVVMQDADYQLYGSSVDEEMELGIKNPSLKRKEKLLKLLNLDKFYNRHPGALSGGQKQRLTIATSLMQEKKIYLFDEPTSGLDLEGMNQVSSLIKYLSQKGKIIFVISHDFELLSQTCSRIIHLEKGKIRNDFHMTEEGLKNLRRIFFNNLEVK